VKASAYALNGIRLERAPGGPCTTGKRRLVTADTHSKQRWESYRPFDPRQGTEANVALVVNREASILHCRLSQLGGLHFKRRKRWPWCRLRRKSAHKHVDTAPATLPAEERRAQGKALRDAVPREAYGTWKTPKIDVRSTCSMNRTSAGCRNWSLSGSDECCSSLVREGRVKAVTETSR
jgi:hypothetical protein